MEEIGDGGEGARPDWDALYGSAADPTCRGAALACGRKTPCGGGPPRRQAERDHMGCLCVFRERRDPSKFSVFELFVDGAIDCRRGVSQQGPGEGDLMAWAQGARVAVGDRSRRRSGPLRSCIAMCATDCISRSSMSANVWPTTRSRTRSDTDNLLMDRSNRETVAEYCRGNITPYSAP